jgi:hypothetical protein
MSKVYDLPDNHQWFPGSKRYVLQDDAELAARLGSPVVFDRRGQMAWGDRFDAGLAGWVYDGNGTGWAVKVTVSKTLFPGYAIELTGGSDSVRFARMLKHFGAPDIGRAGVEISTAFLSEFDKLHISLQRFTGALWIYGRIRIDRTNNLLSYQDAAGNEQTIAALPAPDFANAVYQFSKLVLDWDAGEYVRFLYNEEEYDLSGEALYSEADTTQPQHLVSLVFYSRSGSNDRCQIGHVVLTVGEP